MFCRRGSGNIIASPGNSCGKISHCGLPVGGMEMSAAAMKIRTSPRSWPQWNIMGSWWILTFSSLENYDLGSCKQFMLPRVEFANLSSGLYQSESFGASNRNRLWLILAKGVLLGGYGVPQRTGIKMDELWFSIELGISWQELPDSLFGSAFRMNDHSFSASESLKVQILGKNVWFSNMSLTPAWEQVHLDWHSTITACQGAG